MTVERNLAREDLNRRGMISGQSCTYDGSFLRLASTITIAKAKISPSLLYLAPSKISGAVQRNVYPRWRVAVHEASKSWAIAVRPKSAIRARPEQSTRMFDWLGVNVATDRDETTTYSLKVAMNHIA